MEAIGYMYVMSFGDRRGSVVRPRFMVWHGMVASICLCSPNLFLSLYRTPVRLDVLVLSWAGLDKDLKLDPGCFWWSCRNGLSGPRGHVKGVRKLDRQTRSDGDGVDRPQRTEAGGGTLEIFRPGDMEMETRREQGCYRQLDYCLTGRLKGARSAISAVKALEQVVGTHTRQPAETRRDSRRWTADGETTDRRLAAVKVVWARSANVGGVKVRSVGL